MRYLYQCRDCGTREERECPMGEQPPTIACPRCRGIARRVFTAPPIHYKGTGWTGAGHGIPDLDERDKLPGPLEFDDLLEE
jgi:putative FmdB family regulatory protein